MSRARSESSAQPLSREVASTDACCSRAAAADTSPKQTSARSSTISPPRLTASLRFPRPVPEFPSRCARDKRVSKRSSCSSILSCAKTAITRLSGARSPRCIHSTANPSGGGAPVLFDPAVYWGDREADLAMTELFGGFPQAFYSAYAEAAPLDQGYAVRKTLYNLYHVLNHANLFGGGYATQAERMIERLLAELR